MMELQGQVAIITGASRGIGFGIAEELVSAGARVCLTGRNADALQTAAASLGGPLVALPVAGKADDPAHQSEAVARTLETFGRLDMLVNNVGINPAYGTLMDLDLAVARKTFEVNALATLSWVQHCHRAAMAEGGGSIVNVSSLSSIKHAPGLGMYGATKSMLEHLTRTLGQELAPTVRVNAVAPAVVKTAFAAKLYEQDEAETAARFPLQRLGVPQDVAHAVRFLLGPRSAWITGQVLLVDGGLSLTGGY